MVLRTLVYVPTNPPHLLTGLQYYNGPGDTVRSTLYATYDRGETWIPKDRSLYDQAPMSWWQLNVLELAVDPRDAQRLFMGTSNGIVRSIDAGETWQFVIGDFDLMLNGIFDLLIDPRRNNRIWAAGEGAIFVPFVALSEDSGATWTYAAPRCNGVVYETPVNSLALAPDMPDRLFLGAEVGLFMSDQAGADGSWDCPNSIKGTVAGFAEYEGHLYASTIVVTGLQGSGGTFEQTTLGLYRTDDNGETWVSLSVPNGTPGATVMAVDTAKHRILMGTRQGLWAVSRPR